MRDGGFEIQRTWEGRERARLAQEARQKGRVKGSKHDETTTIVEWEGLSEIILGRKEWFDAWLAGEQRCESLATGALDNTDRAVISSRGQTIQRHDQFAGRMAAVG